MARQRKGRKRGNRRRRGRKSHGGRNFFSAGYKRFSHTVQRRTLEDQLGFPEIKTMKLRYCDRFTLQSALGVITSAEFRATEVYDPRVAMGGHQPMGLDQLLGIYYNYAYVKGAKCTVKFLPEADGTAVPIACGILCYDSTNDSLTTQGYNNWETIKEAGYPVKTQSTLKSSAVATSFFSMTKNAHRLKLPENSTSNGAPPTAGPEWRFNIWLQNVDYSAADTSQSYICELCIDYVVDFFDRIPLVGS